MVTIKKYMLTVNNEIINTSQYRVSYSPAGEPNWFCFDSYEGFESIGGWNNQKVEVKKSSDNILDLIDEGDLLEFRDPDTGAIKAKIYYEGELKSLEDPNLYKIKKLSPDGKKLYSSELIELDDGFKTWDCTEMYTEQLISSLPITLNKNGITLLSINAKPSEVDNVVLLSRMLNGMGYEVVFIDNKFDLQQMTKEDLLMLRGKIDYILNRMEE